VNDGRLEIAERARRWHHDRQAVVCDVSEPWAHGTVLKATPFPDYWDFNLVRVEDEPGLTVAELVAFADEALAGFPHRRIDFDRIEAAEPLRPGFEALGWRTERLLCMRYEGRVPQDLGIAVEEVTYDAVDRLRRRWYAEDFPDEDPGDFHEQARAVALARGVRVLAVRHDGEPIAYAQVDRIDDAAEVSHVYVDSGHRGEGLGTELTAAAIAAAGSVADLWIYADDEDRPKRLYERLGFRPAWTSMEVTRAPS
jgi:ribosomal protein S18 acetylase RimI-like enzyme